MTQTQKHVLVYGDSLTWGLVPATRNRYPLNERWPQVTEKHLGGTVRITTEAVPGRTTVWDDPFRKGRNGRADFLMLLLSHAPVDLVVIMLGINDLQKLYPAGAAQAAKGVGLIARDALDYTGDGQPYPPGVLIVAPTLVREDIDFFPEMEGAADASRKLARELEKTANELGCSYYNASNAVTASQLDGVHLDRDETIELGRLLVEPVRLALEI